MERKRRGGRRREREGEVGRERGRERDRQRQRHREIANVAGITGCTPTRTGLPQFLSTSVLKQIGKRTESLDFNVFSGWLVGFEDLCKVVLTKNIKRFSH